MTLVNPLDTPFDSSVYFYTATIYKWQHLLVDDNRKQIIIDSIKFMVNEKRINLYAFVIMPNHIHLIYSPNENYPHSDFKRDFLKFTAQVLRNKLIETGSRELLLYKSSQNDRNYQIWKRHSLAIPIYYASVFKQKLEYIHLNPCQPKWALADFPELYLYSSAEFYKQGLDRWGILSFMDC